MQYDHKNYDYKKIFEKTPTAISVIVDHQFVAINDSFAEMICLGNDDDFKALNPSQLSPKYQPDGLLSVEKELRMLKLAEQNGSHKFEWLHKSLDNSMLLVDVQLTFLGSSGTFLSVWTDISGSKTKEKELLEIESKYEEIIKAKTSELKKTTDELEFMQKRLLETKKLESLSEIILGISHKLSDPIGTSLTLATYIEKQLEECNISANEGTLSKSNTFF